MLASCSRLKTPSSVLQCHKAYYLPRRYFHAGQRQLLTKYFAETAHVNPKRVASVGTTPELAGLKLGGLPEVIVTGRANSGKSSLFNAVLGRKDLIATSKTAGRTRRLDFFTTGSLILVDAPGYGARGRPEWGALFDEYVRTRAELRRIYVTLNANHEMHEADRQMLSHLSSMLFASSRQTFTIQTVITKSDSVPPAQLQSNVASIRASLKELARTTMSLPPIITSTKMLDGGGSQRGFGVDDVRWSILEACGLSTI